VTPETIGKDKKAGDGGARRRQGGDDLNVAHARNFLDCVKSRKRPERGRPKMGHRSAV